MSTRTPCAHTTPATTSYHPAGGRLLVKDYPKDREYRCFKLSEHIVTKIEQHIEVNQLGPGHATIATTERYLHTLPDADETALDARHAIRTRNSQAALAATRT